MDKQERGNINHWLTLSYGYATDDRPNYRLVWGPDQYENRWGTFEEYKGNIFIRRFTGVKHLPKYQEHGSVHIIEKFVPNFQPEILVGQFYSYEPIWVFDKKDVDGNIVHPWLSAIQFFMKMAVDGPKNLASRLVNDIGDSYDQEAQMFSDELEHEAPNKAYGGVGIL